MAHPASAGPHARPGLDCLRMEQSFVRENAVLGSSQFHGDMSAMGIRWLPDVASPYGHAGSAVGVGGVDDLGLAAGVAGDRALTERAARHAAGVGAGRRRGGPQGSLPRRAHSPGKPHGCWRPSEHLTLTGAQRARPGRIRQMPADASPSHSRRGRGPGPAEKTCRGLNRSAGRRRKKWLGDLVSSADAEDQIAAEGADRSPSA